MKTVRPLLANTALATLLLTLGGTADAANACGVATHPATGWACAPTVAGGLSATGPLPRAADTAATIQTAQAARAAQVARAAHAAQPTSLAHLGTTASAAIADVYAAPAAPLHRVYALLLAAMASAAFIATRRGTRR